MINIKLNISQNKIVVGLIITILLAIVLFKLKKTTSEGFRSIYSSRIKTKCSPLPLPKSKPIPIIPTTCDNLIPKKNTKRQKTYLISLKNKITIHDDTDLNDVPEELKEEIKDAAKLIAIRDKYPDNHKLEEIIVNDIHEPGKNGPKIKAFLQSIKGKRFLQKIKRRNIQTIEIDEDIVNEPTTSYPPTVTDNADSKFDFVKCEYDNGYRI